MSWALQQANLKPGGSAVRDRLVLVYLADRYNDETGVCWPSVPTIAGHLGVTTRTIRYALTSLREQGLIAHGHPRHVEHIPADSRPTVWRLMMDSDSSERGVTGDLARGEAAFTPQKRGDAQFRSRGEAAFTAGVKHVSPKPEENLNKEPEGAAEVKALINQATAPTEPAPSSLDDLAAQHFSSEKHPGAYGTPEHPRCRKHRNEPSGWFEPCSGCRQAKDIFTNQSKAETRAATEATYQRQMGKHTCTICDQAGFRLTYNTKTGLTRPTACKHTPADQLDQQTAQARHNAA